MVTRHVIRYLAAAVSAAVAAAYFLIAVGAISVVSTAPQAGDWVIPGSAAAAFALLAALLVATKNRIVPALGTAVSILTIVGYFVVAPHRSPSFEVWGIAIKVAQVILVATLGYLAVSGSEPRARRQAA